MPTLRHILRAIGALALVIAIPVSFAEPMLGTVNLDKFFRQDIDIKRLTLDKNGQALNLMAQMKDPTQFTENVNDFNQFIAVGNLYFLSKGFAYITEFNKLQMIYDRKLYGDVWLGVLPFAKTDIPKMSFQEGLRGVKQCMSKQGVTLPDKIARFVVYKVNVPPNDMIYDYVFHKEDAPANECIEALYAPNRDLCSMGMAVNCHFEMRDLGPKPASSVEQPK